MSVSPHPDAIRAIRALVDDGLERLEASLATLANNEDPVLGPMLSSVLPGSGKRLRPALALLIGRMAAARDLVSLPVALEKLRSTSCFLTEDLIAQVRAQNVKSGQ